MIKGNRETIENKANEQKDGILGTPSSALASVLLDLLENISEGEGARVAKRWKRIMRAGEKTVRAGKYFNVSSYFD